jgi:hypothetical protein
MPEGERVYLVIHSCEELHRCPTAQIVESVRSRVNLIVMLPGRKAAQFIEEIAIPCTAFDVYKPRFTGRRERHRPHFLRSRGTVRFHRETGQIPKVVFDLIDTSRAGILC